jgi:hypothetical protein
MNDLTSALLAALGTSGLAGFGALVLRAFLQALKATAEISAEKNRTIERQASTIARQDAEIEDLQLQLVEAFRAAAMKDIAAAGLRAENERLMAELARRPGATGTG